MKYLFTLIALCGFIVTGTAQSFEWNTKSASPAPGSVQANSPAYEKAFNERQFGQAGIYPANLQGSRTSSGEAYTPNQLTASHPLLPVGTIVRVQNLDNGRAVSVRINDQGRECSSCLLMLSSSAANQLGITYQGRVAVERTGFSNWNPSPVAQPTTFAATQPGNLTRPVEINRTNQWESRSGTATPDAYGSNNSTSPLAYGSASTSTNAGTSNYSRPSAYGSATAAYQGNYTALNPPSAPSVMSREVQPAAVSRQPATYSRYPTAVSPASQPNTQPRAYQPAPRAAATTTYAPVYQQPAPVQQATPPPSTVMRYQQDRTVPAPATYNAPVAYNPPATQMTARGVSPVAVSSAAATAAPTSGYVVQLGAYNNESYAKNRVAQLQKMGLSNVFYRAVQKTDGQMINRVYAGTFASMAEAQQASKLIRGNYQIAGIVSSLQ